jgi:signal transduction histidine kinase
MVARPPVALRRRSRRSAAADAGAGPADAGLTVPVGDHEEGFFVADDGPGIPPADREAVFERGSSTAGDGPSIVEGIVEAHGWDSDLQESDAGGARFAVTVV